MKEGGAGDDEEESCDSCWQVGAVIEKEEADVEKEVEIEEVEVPKNGWTEVRGRRQRKTGR